LPKKPTVKQLLKVSRSRARVAKQVKDFLERANSFLPAVEEKDLNQLEDESIDTPPEESVEPEEVVEVSLEEDDLDADLFEDQEDETDAPSVLPETVVPSSSL
jgi:hypothetical protein